MKKTMMQSIEGGRPFKVEAPFVPSGDQPQAIESLAEGINRGEWAQVLLGCYWYW